MHVAEVAELPVDPRVAEARNCRCGGRLRAETDVMDTWATSSLSPQLATRWGEEGSMDGLLPMSMRPLAHEIIRTWGGPASPAAMIERYSAGALRYWAASTGLGKDAIISIERIASAQKMLWNMGRFTQRFLADYKESSTLPAL
jgi:valyl-tRNA synthetase